MNRVEIEGRPKSLEWVLLVLILTVAWAAFSGERKHSARLDALEQAVGIERVEEVER